MKKCIFAVMIFALIYLAGCGGIRLAASEDMKLNAWVHNRTTQLAAETAGNENASDKLCSLTNLAARQSNAFIADTGLPENIPADLGVEQILSEDTNLLAEKAINDANRKIDPWDVADEFLNFGIAIAALFGGAGAVKAAGFLKNARDKSRALKEIVEANELFKKVYPESAKSWKEMQAQQSKTTKNIVAEVKNEN